MKTFNLYNGAVRLDFHESGHKYQVTENGVTTSPVGCTKILNVLSKPALLTWPLNESIKYLGGVWDDNKKQWVVKDKTLTTQLLNEAAKAYTRKSDKGMDVGKEVHAAIESFLKNEDVYIPANEGGKAFNSFVKWFNDTAPRVIATEQPVYSRKYGYAGTFDALLEIDGKIVLCDIKTTNASRTAPLGIYPEYFLQLGGYSYAYTEERLPESAKAKGVTAEMAGADDLMVISASKTGKLNTLRASEIGLKVADCEQSFLNCVSLFNNMKDLGSKLKEVK